MRYMMFMIPKVYQPDTPDSEKAAGNPTVKAQVESHKNT
jgi:hypothetical protein